MGQGRKSPYKPVQVDELFAAYHRSGQLLWITLRPSRSESTAALHRINPPLEGFDYPWTVQPVTVAVDLGYQYDLEDTAGDR